EKRLAIQNIRSQKEQPFHLAFEQLRQLMYSNHPYSMSVLGDETTMSNITRADLVEYHQTHFRPDNIVISIAGRIRLEAAQQLTRIFGDWKIPNCVKQPLNLPSIITSPKLCIKPLNTQQSIIMLGYLGSSVDNPEYAALKLLSSYL
ncbi:MAG: M16 family metallopeptidase, partial [Dolichospermum sp.]